MNNKLFTQQTLDSSLFHIQDVVGDNACFYRALANYIFYISDNANIQELLEFKTWGQLRDLQEVDEAFGEYSQLQNFVAKNLQIMIHKYISNNPTEKLEDMGNITIEEAVPMIHEIEWEEYLAYYCKFAGDCEMEETEEFYIDRWGSVLEQCIISKLIQCPLIVLNTQRWDKKHGKIVNGKIVHSKAQKGVRFKPTTIIGKKYTNKPPIYLIWREYNGEGHYLACYPKNQRQVLHLIHKIV